MSKVSPALLSFLLVLVVACSLQAQNPGDARPVVGLRENVPADVVLQNARVVVEPGNTMEEASVLIRGQSIVAVGKSLSVPAGTQAIDCSGKTIYAGLIDAYGEIDVPDPPTSDAKHWNGNVVPRRSAATSIDEVSDVAKFRAQGIAIRLIAPKGAIIKGTSCLVLLDRDSRVSLYEDGIAQHLQLTVPRDRRRDSYPNSPMGAIALLRQSLFDADWYNKAWASYRADPSLPLPQRNDDLASIATSCLYGRFIIDAPNERMALRAHKIASEFFINALVRGSGREYRSLEEIAGTGRPLLIPVDFPDAPSVDGEAAAENASLRDLLHWRFAPENPLRLHDAGARFCLTTDGLDDAKDFLKNIRIAVRRGLPADVALASLTTQPAEWFGVDPFVGRVRAGSLANLVIADGDLFADGTSVLETWVAGKRFLNDDAVEPEPDALIGSWETVIKVDGRSIPVRMDLERDKKKWTGKLVGKRSAKPAAQGKQGSKKKAADESGKQDEADESAELNELARAVDRLTAWVDLSRADADLPGGPSQITLVTIEQAGSVSVFSTVTFADGTSRDLSWSPIEEADDEGDDSEDESESDEDENVDDDAAGRTLDEIVVNHPLGGFGVTEPIAPVPAVLFRGATVWTCGDQGVLQQADVLVQDGKIIKVAESIKAPQGCQVIDCKGKHITPGLIDCHSHMATDGGVNESGQAVTAEVRVGDFVDNSDINIYRQLAGGLTIANILHGSANPIGGQNQVIKLRWGDSMDAMKMASAPQGIKFALGENVKRSNRIEPQTRYPSSRMGVEQLFRDRFLAAEEYARAHRDWNSGKRGSLPPRRDLELDALAEILDGRRWIHCHSYRQDEIVALLDLLDRFEITIGTLQHILEGYKVADRMLKHGAMASAFSDWWAYKFEVYDAIPDNGAIMHDVGIVVSFNSDDRELARHMNTEAAKAVKYGNVPPEEALKFVTLNPAKQLRIDDRVGSLEAGKDADVVVWSGPPLSTLSRCEQTWVDGRPMFSLQKDLELRARDRHWKSLLVASILDEDFARSSGEDSEIDEEDRWLRYDEFCHGQDHDDQCDQNHAHHLHFGHNHQEVQR